MSFLTSLVIVNGCWMFIAHYLIQSNGSVLGNAEYEIVWYALAVTSNTLLLPVGWWLMYQMYPQMKMEMRLKQRNMVVDI